MSNLNILFVCTGNICRSPMAEQIFNQLASKHQLPVTAHSAGLAAMTGEPMTAESQQAMANLNYTPAAHHAKDLTPEMLANSDLVLAMTLEHRSDIARMLPKASRYSFTLDEFSRLVYFLTTNPEHSIEFTKRLEETREEFLRRAISEAILLRGMVPTGDDPKDVTDPYGEGIEVYKEVAENIDSMVKLIMEWMAG